MCGSSDRGSPPRKRHGANVGRDRNRVCVSVSDRRVPGAVRRRIDRSDGAEAKPLVTAVRGRHDSSEGKSYRQDWFEGVAERLLAAVAAAPPDLIECVLASLDADDGVPPNDLALARIARQMDVAAHQLTITRDIDEWRATTARLDAEREAVLAAEPSRAAIDPVVARQYLLDLAGIWRQADPRARQELALALWDAWEFLGFKEATYRWSAAARGYGLDRLVPSELNIELSSLALPGLPLGGFTLKAAAARLDRPRP
jgi:hypothetical protein